MQQIDHEQVVIVETKITELGREGVLEGILALARRCITR
jgi:hypothetical protein